MTISGIGGQIIPGRSGTTPAAPAPLPAAEPSSERVAGPSAAAPGTGQIVDKAA
jgi:hypothetical protein